LKNYTRQSKSSWARLPASAAYKAILGPNHCHTGNGMSLSVGRSSATLRRCYGGS